MRNSRSNLGFVRILACRLDIICLRHCGTRLVVILWVHFAPPCFQGLGVLTSRHSDARPGCGNRLRSYALLRTRTMFVPRLVLFCSRAAPCESRPHICGRFHQIAIVPAVLRIGSVNRAVLWLAPLKMANLRTRNPARTHSPLKSTWSWVPSDTYTCAEIAHYSHLQHANELGECHLEQGKHLWDENLMGDHGHFYVTHTSWGSRVAFLRLKKLRWVILGPRRIFSKYCLHTACTRYSVMSLLLHVIMGTD